jgi:hypothetical protein
LFNQSQGTTHHQSICIVSLLLTTNYWQTTERNFQKVAGSDETYLGGYGILSNNFDVSLLKLNCTLGDCMNENGNCGRRGVPLKHIVRSKVHGFGCRDKCTIISCLVLKVEYLYSYRTSINWKIRMLVSLYFTFRVI